jgi:hypothetical protein
VKCPRLYDLFLRIFGTRYEVDGLHVSHIDFVAQYVCEDDLCNIPGDAEIQMGRGMDGDAPQLTSSSDNRQGFRLGSVSREDAMVPGEVRPLNFLRIFAISLFILFSSNSRTRAPRMSAMN